jgi:hypothetical protein
MNPNLVNPDIVLNMRTIYKLIFIGIEIVILIIGYSLYCQGKYFEAPKEKKPDLAKYIKGIGILWFCIGFVYMVFWLLALAGIL